MDSTELRESFLKFMRDAGYKFLPPAKVSDVDQSLLFVNSGMVQLKDIFLGKKPIDEKFTKMMNYQHCIRAGGKHNDLDDVGKDSYHLSCFLMNGYWVLREFSKKEAIRIAYTFLTDICKLKKEQMYVTYFEGNDEMKEDVETKELWKIYIDENKIIKGNFKDNFWQMGNEGPCGSCTEVHYDLIGNRDASDLVNKDDPTVIEIWNSVFIQYNKTSDGFIPFDLCFCDIGWGHERVCMVIQGKKSLYQTDIFTPLIGYAQVLSKAQYYTDDYNNNPTDTAYRIFADHIRTTVLCLYQGVDFDATKRGFVLRKVFRRLLSNYYIHLNNCTVKQTMNLPIIDCLISHVLTDFGFKNFDVTIVKNKMIEEEKEYIKRIHPIKAKYNKYQKQKLSKEDVTKLLKKNEGIDEIFVEYIDKLKIIV